MRRDSTTTAIPPENVLVFRDVTKTYIARTDSCQVLDRLNLDVRLGDRIAIVGPNGSGKTTLFRLMLGVEAPDSGRVIYSPAHELRSVVGYIPQDYRNALYPWFTLSRNIQLALQRADSDGNDSTSEDWCSAYRAAESAFRLDLDLNSYPYRLSGGEQQIFVFLRALLRRPAVLLMDEPLSAVDYGRRRLIHEYLGAWAKGTTRTMVFATHDFEEAVLLADRVLVLGTSTGSFESEIRVSLPWPRTYAMKDAVEFRSAVEAIVQTVVLR